ncbi:MAG: hypothetical protein J6C04_09140, partial [Oscillospiraceae bacterium]|nr:hypothetical protein [Oscillospiraceae bacterium]
MKKLLAILISLSLFISLTACGGSTPAENGGEGAKPNTQTTQQGGSENSGQNGGAASADISSVSVENYAEIVKKAFGIEIVLDDGWTVTKASSPNGVNNVDLVFTIPAGTDGEAEIEKYFNQAVKLSGVWAHEIDWDTFAISKGTQYTDFADFYTNENEGYGDFYSVMWLYDYNGKNVQFSYMQDGTAVSMTFTYATLNYEIDINDWVPQEGQGPEGWTWQDCHGYIDNVWDSDTLPENFPKEISGVRVSETRYFGFGCED